jgi:putative hydrolase of the HAD superfamily
MDLTVGWPSKITKKMTNTYWSTFAAKNRPYPGAEAVLSKLKKNGYKLGLVTDTDGKKGMKRIRLRRLSLVRFFDTVAIGGDDTSHAKPSPESFLLAAKKLHVAPEECLMVGDKPFTDIRGAKAAGMKAVLLKKREWKIGAKPDAVIHKLPDVLLLLKKP